MYDMRLLVVVILLVPALAKRPPKNADSSDSQGDQSGHKCHPIRFQYEAIPKLLADVCDFGITLADLPGYVVRLAARTDMRPKTEKALWKVYSALKQSLNGSSDDVPNDVSLPEYVCHSDIPMILDHTVSGICEQESVDSDFLEMYFDQLITALNSTVLSAVFGAVKEEAVWYLKNGHRFETFCHGYKLGKHHFDNHHFLVKLFASSNEHYNDGLSKFCGIASSPDFTMQHYKDELDAWKKQSDAILGHSNDFLYQLLTDVTKIGASANATGNSTANSTSVAQSIMKEFCRFGLRYDEIVQGWCGVGSTMRPMFPEEAAAAEKHREELLTMVQGWFSPELQPHVGDLISRLESQSRVCEHADRVKEMVAKHTIHLTIRRVNRARVEPDFTFEVLENIANRSLSELKNLVDMYMPAHPDVYTEVELSFKDKLAVFAKMAPQELQEALSFDIIMVLQNDRFQRLFQLWVRDYGRIVQRASRIPAKRLERFVGRAVANSPGIRAATSFKNFDVGFVAVRSVHGFIAALEQDKNVTVSGEEREIHQMIDKKVEEIQAKKHEKGVKKLANRLVRRLRDYPKTDAEAEQLFRRYKGFFERTVERFGSFMDEALNKIEQQFDLVGNKQWYTSKEFLSKWAVENLDDE